jgi:hypothetical protein
LRGKFLVPERSITGLVISLRLRRTRKIGTATKKDNDNGDVAVNFEANLEKIVRSAVPEASLLNNVGTEMSFQLPIGAASQFTPMFEALDRRG